MNEADDPWADPLLAIEHIAGLLPQPIPASFRLWDATERAQRGRYAMLLWLLGFTPRLAWLVALSRDAHQPIGAPLITPSADTWLVGECLRKRLVAARDGERRAAQSGADDVAA
jgi:hypothetical protein